MPLTNSLISVNCGKIAPDSVEEYIQTGGYEGLKIAFTMKPEEVVEEVSAAKLLGRGGAAYPAGAKWKQLLAIKHFPKYIVCNADEGEPGTFKDKLLLEQDPLRIIEGMTIAGYVFGSSEGYIYIRGEYRGIQKIFQAAINNAKKIGTLGSNIMGTNFSFDIRVMTGAGAYICGENSALLNSIEGKPGRPRVKPPHLAEVGLFGKPTLVNNVETFANIPTILKIGGVAYLRIGTPDSGGTKLICLSGHVNKRGVYEIPFGVTLREIIFNQELGGGIPEGKALKFFHLGGQSGPLGSPEQCDTKYCYKSLRNIGLSAGSGAVVAADESVCVIDYLKKVCEFFIHESCGKCTTCRLGNKQVYKLLCKLSDGAATSGDIALLRQLSHTMMNGSFCGLGQAATTALESALRLFWPEFEAHLAGVCPSGVCL